MNYKSIMRGFELSCLAAMLMIVTAGCPSRLPPVTPPTAEMPDPHAGHDHSHGHADEGPHGGHIVEIGDEQMHAEWTHDDSSGEVVIYLLDSSGKSDATISEPAILITTKIGETAKTYELPAVSQEDGLASRFSLTDPSLTEALKAVGPGIEAKISVKVNDELLVGKFEHHDHSGHKH